MGEKIIFYGKKRKISSKSVGLCCRECVAVCSYLSNDFQFIFYYYYRCEAMGDMSHDTDERKVKREQFINDLMGFHAAVGTPLMRMPTINGQDVDLLGLYEAVTSLGGWERVSDNDQWPEVVAQLELPDACVNSSVALKQIYLRFLDKYEKNNFAYKIRGEPEDEVKHSRLG